MLRSALSRVSPARSAGEASDALCRVREVARSASVPRCRRRHGRLMADIVASARCDVEGWRVLAEVDQEYVDVSAVVGDR
jgi:hypothetical protein